MCALATGYCPVIKADSIQTAQVQTKRLWASSKKGMSLEGNHRESERAGGGMRPDDTSSLSFTGFFSQPDGRQLRPKAPLRTPCPSPGSCESCPGFSWCAVQLASQRGSGTNTPSSVSLEQRVSREGGSCFAHHWLGSIKLPLEMS